jgi:hypothetical protein
MTNPLREALAEARVCSRCCDMARRPRAAQWREPMTSRLLLAEAAKDAVREVRSCAISYGHPLSGGIQKTELIAAVSEADAAIDALLASPAEAAITRIRIPTDTMEQEFQLHYRRGFEAGRKATAEAAERVPQWIPVSPQTGLACSCQPDEGVPCEAENGGLKRMMWGWRDAALRDGAALKEAMERIRTLEAQLADAERRVKFTAERWQIECERERYAAWNDGIEAAAKKCDQAQAESNQTFQLLAGTMDQLVPAGAAAQAEKLADAIRALKRHDPSTTQAELEDAAETLKALESMVPRGGIEPPTP